MTKEQLLICRLTSLCCSLISTYLLHLLWARQFEILSPSKPVLEFCKGETAQLPHQNIFIHEIILVYIWPHDFKKASSRTHECPLSSYWHHSTKTFMATSFEKIETITSSSSGLEVFGQINTCNRATKQHRKFAKLLYPQVSHKLFAGPQSIHLPCRNQTLHLWPSFACCLTHQDLTFLWCLLWKLKQEMLQSRANGRTTSWPNRTYQSLQVQDIWISASSLWSTVAASRSFISWGTGGLMTVMGITALSERRPCISRCSWHNAHQCMQQCTIHGSHGEFCRSTKLLSLNLVIFGGKITINEQSPLCWPNHAPAHLSTIPLHLQLSRY